MSLDELDGSAGAANAEPKKTRHGIAGVHNEHRHGGKNHHPKDVVR